MLDGGKFSLAIRIPHYVQSYNIIVNGQAVQGEMKNGYCYVSRNWQPGDIAKLSFDLPVRRIHADPRVRDCVGKAALARGPLIYCFEETDQKVPVFSLSLLGNADTQEFRPIPGLPDDLIGLRIFRKDKTKQINGQENQAAVSYELNAIPYFAWSNREKGDMAVWIEGL